MDRETYTKPPRTVFGVLCEAKSKGIKIPKEVYDWWELNTTYQGKPFKPILGVGRDPEEKMGWR